MISILLLLILLPLMFGIPVLVGVYVYHDAKKRGMNAALWLLITLLTPIFLGLVIYLLVREAPLPEFADGNAGAERPKDNTLWKVLLAIIVIPVALVLLLIAVFSAVNRGAFSNSYATGFGAMTVEEYLETSDRREEIEAWLTSCDSTADSVYYVLQYTPEYETEEYQYLVYIPGASNYVSSDAYPEKKLFSGWTFQLEVTTTGVSGNQQLYLFSYTGSDAPGAVKVLYNGEKGTTEVTESLEPLMEN